MIYNYVAVDFDHNVNICVDDRPIGYPWRIASAICVQRFPTLAREKTPFELEYQTLREQIYVENSRLSDFELEEREILRKKRAREKKAMEEDIDVSQVQTIY